MFFTGTASQLLKFKRNNFNTVWKLVAFCKVVLLNPNVGMLPSNFKESIVSHYYEGDQSTNYLILCVSVFSHINTQKTWAHKPQSLSDIKLLVIWRVVSLRGVLNLSQLTEYHPAPWNLHSRKRKHERSHLSYLCTIKCTAQRGLQELLTSYCLFLYQIRVLIHTKG